MESGSPTVLFAGGGTGGTVGPGIAVAERLRSLDPSLNVVFLCSDRPVDRRLLDPGGWNVVPTTARSPSLRPRAGIQFLRGWRAARKVAGTQMSHPDRGRLVALGGFVAPPVVAEAVRRGMPVDLLNLDAVAGRANRWIARRADRVMTSVETDLPVSGLPIGVPLRRGSIPDRSPEEARITLGLEADRPTLLVTGASQGARSIDRFLLAMLQSRPGFFGGWQVLHLAGGDVDALSDAYSNAGIKASVRPFLETMGLAWSAADLAISRGGASSVAEIAMSRTPAIILPYPWHADRHQARNAAWLQNLGAVTVLDDPVLGDEAVEALENALGRRLSDPGSLKAHRSGFPVETVDAAEVLAKSILSELRSRR